MTEQIFIKTVYPDSHSLTLFRVLAYGTLVSTYVLIVVGGYVSATRSGLACPDWPLCRGQLIPPLEEDVLIEYSHRMIAAIVTLLVLLMTAYSLIVLKGERNVMVLSTTSFILLMIQVILGMLTVKSELDPTISTAHLGLGTGVFALVLANALAVRNLTARQRTSLSQSNS